MKHAASVSVDHRRKNKNAEQLSINVDGLKAYKSKLVLFPRNATSKRAKKGDTPKAQRANVAKQTVTSASFPAVVKQKKIHAQKITAKERDATVTTVLRKARTDALLWGRREKREKDKAAAAAGKKGKAEADAPMDE